MSEGRTTITSLRGQCVGTGTHLRERWDFLLVGQNGSHRRVVNFEQVGQGRVEQADALQLRNVLPQARVDRVEQVDERSPCDELGGVARGERPAPPLVLCVEVERLVGWWVRVRRAEARLDDRPPDDGRAGLLGEVLLLGGDLE